MTFKDKTDKRRYANIHIRILVLGSRSACTTAYHLIRIQNYQRHPSDRASAAVTVRIQLITDNINLRRPIDLRTTDGPQNELNLQIWNTWLPEYLPLPPPPSSTYGRRCICHCDNADRPCVCAAAYTAAGKLSAVVEIRLAEH